MAFATTFSSTCFSNGPQKEHHFAWSCLANDTTGSIVCPSFGDRVTRVVLGSAIALSAATTYSGTTATVTVLPNQKATYTYTVSSAAATVGSIYASATGDLFTTSATIAASVTLVTTGSGNPAASGTLTKISGTGDSTITYSAFTAATLYGDGIAFGV